ncbi:hypothetical protein FGG08_007339 [Glutinoglossum americanum]|uniref:ABC transmembrane type-1 domain-containing protein n=1 Tax=Glutinoglossum americanum TaxID=1670608 RepID=A0A9P8L059_9PEZI|nr:hypothetical protein FGG08_007339 [Glutinoglossum americanum]
MVFLGVLLSYSIVVYKGYVARKRKQEAVGLRVMLQNEDMQYLYLISALRYGTATGNAEITTSDPGTKAASETLKSAIGKAVRNSYDTSMTVVSLVELGAWFHILISVLFSQKDSWILLCLYSVFLRARFEQGTFVAAAIRVLTRKLDSLFGSASMPAGVNGAWNSVKDIMRQAVEITDLNGYTTVAHSSGGHKGTD